MNITIKIETLAIFWFFILLGLNTSIISKNEAKTDACNNSCAIDQFCSTGICLCKKYVLLNKTCDGRSSCGYRQRCEDNLCYDSEKCVKSTDEIKISTTDSFFEKLGFSFTYNKTEDTKMIKFKCDFHRHCGVNEVCPQGFCECEQNHRHNHKYDCIRFNCNTDSDCNELDIYSFCRKNQCQCRDESYYDYQTGGCIPIQNCSSEKECHNNQTCQRSICKCKLNYKWNFTARRCLYSGCEEDIDCFISAEHNCKCLESHNCSCNKKIDKQVEQNNSMNNFEFKFDVMFSVLILLFLQFIK
jgi:hypothetical protein